MSKKTNPADEPATDKDPAHQTDESHGAVRGRQVTGNNRATKDLPRGSEAETRGSSSTR